jgi:hypothetical protein
MRLNQPLKSAVVPPIDNVVNGVLHQLEHFSVFARGKSLIPGATRAQPTMRNSKETFPSAEARDAQWF